LGYGFGLLAVGLVKKRKIGPRPNPNGKGKEAGLSFVGLADGVKLIGLYGFVWLFGPKCYG
jgi:hypothetical protein